MTVEEARRQFPHTWTDLIYLNHAAISPMSFVAREAVGNYLERRSIKDIDCIPWVFKIVEETKQRVAETLGATSDRIAFSLNTTDAFNILAGGVKWNEGDRILLYRYEYPANVYPFVNQAKHGVEVDFFDASDHRITVDVIAKHVQPTTRLLSLSSVQFATGYFADLEVIGKFCKEKGIIFSVDAIQSAPFRKIDVEKCHIDFLASGSHKWMMSPEGVSFIYVRRGLQDDLEMHSLGWTSVRDPFNTFAIDPNRLREDAGRFENGMMNFSGIAGMNAVLKFMSEIGYDTIEKQTLYLTGVILDMLKARGADVVTPSGEHERGGIVCCTIDNPDDVLKRLQSKNITLAVRAGRLRISPYFYNTEEEVRKAVNAVFE